MALLNKPWSLATENTFCICLDLSQQQLVHPPALLDGVGVGLELLIELLNYQRECAFNFCFPTLEQAGGFKEGWLAERFRELPFHGNTQRVVELVYFLAFLKIQRLVHI